jgi:aspartyl-tRNA synthetase
MIRTHTCGELRITDVNKNVQLTGWVQRRRDLGNLTFIDLRDRYGITQLVFSTEINKDLLEKARDIHREYVIQITGIVRERENKNPNLPTGVSEGLRIFNS